MTALSRMTASSPPTFTVAPGTDPDKTVADVGDLLVRAHHVVGLRRRDHHQAGAAIGGAQHRVGAVIGRHHAGDAADGRHPGRRSQHRLPDRRVADPGAVDDRDHLRAVPGRAVNEIRAPHGLGGAAAV